VCLCLENLAQPGASLNLLPLLAARRRDGPEQALRVVLLLDVLEALVVGAVEGLLPVRLEGVGLFSESVSDADLHLDID
jgi:hypothetical protein